MLVLALVCAVTVFALNGGIPALRVGGAPASGSSAAQSSSASAVQAQPPSSQAQLEPAAYTVAFDSRGGSAVEALQNVTQGARIAEPSSPVREGYTFEGWYMRVRSSPITSWHCLPGHFPDSFPLVFPVSVWMHASSQAHAQSDLSLIHIFLYNSELHFDLYLRSAFF